MTDVNPYNEYRCDKLDVITFLKLHDYITHSRWEPKRNKYGTIQKFYAVFSEADAAGNLFRLWKGTEKSLDVVRPSPYMILENINEVTGSTYSTEEFDRMYHLVEDEYTSLMDSRKLRR